MFEMWTIKYWQWNVFKKPKKTHHFGAWQILLGKKEDEITVSLVFPSVMILKKKL